MELTSKNVNRIFMDCLFNEDEEKENPVIGNGIINTYGFHPDRLKSHKKDIGDMLEQLPKEFKADSGGGMSFLNACYTSSGDQWTGLHQDMEQLFALGQACDKVECLLPKELWNALPGGMPYYLVK